MNEPITQKIILASSNAGKLREMREILVEMPFNILPQSEFEVEDAIEDGLSFVENAIIKARHACLHTGLPAIADDSGLEVDALQGAPGIYSARYSGAGDQGNIEKLLKELSGMPEGERGARFRCVIAYMQHAQDPSPLICEGSWQGRISTTAQGDNGFGYDPVFYVPEHQCTSAQLSPAQKNKLSHRGLALQALLKALIIKA